MGVNDDRPSDPSLQPSTHPSSRLGKQSKFANMRLRHLRVCAAAMSRIHRSPIHQKWVKALELVDAEQHCKILHLSSQIHPRNGCFREMLQFRM
jgi:hypothetical protein